MSTTQRNLVDKINKAAEIIHKKSLQPQANWIIVSPEFAEALENLDIRKLRKKKLLEINKKASE